MSRPLFLDRARRRRAALARLGSAMAVVLAVGAVASCMSSAFRPAPVECRR